MSRKSSSVRVECPMVRISTERFSRFSPRGSRLLFVELWNILHVETIIYSQQQRDELESSVNVGPVYRAKFDDVRVVHVDGSLLSDAHRLLPVGVMIPELDHDINRIQAVVTGKEFGYFFQRVSE